MRRSFGNLKRGILARVQTNNATEPAVISLTSGTGYAGSVYTSTQNVGRWYAGETAIPAASGFNYTMEAQYEGFPLTYRTSRFTSNSINWFSPRQLSDLSVWWDAWDLTTLTLETSNFVSSWRSKVGTMFADQTIAARRPVWNITGRNSRPAILTNSGSTQFMDIRNFANQLDDTATGRTHIFTAAFHTTTTNWRGLLDYGTGQGPGGAGIARLIMKSNVTFAGLFTGSQNSLGNVSSSINWNTDKIISAIFRNGANQANALTIDGGLTAQESTPRGTLTTTMNGGFLFTTYNNQPWDGSGQELITFNRELVDADRQRVEGYLASKWGLRGLLPATHPYKSVNPNAVP